MPHGIMIRMYGVEGVRIDENGLVHLCEALYEGSSHELVGAGGERHRRPWKRAEAKYTKTKKSKVHKLVSRAAEKFSTNGAGLSVVNKILQKTHLWEDDIEGRCIWLNNTPQDMAKVEAFNRSLRSASKGYRRLHALLQGEPEPTELGHESVHDLVNQLMSLDFEVLDPGTSVAALSNADRCGYLGILAFFLLWPTHRDPRACIEEARCVAALPW